MKNCLLTYRDLPLVIPSNGTDLFSNELEIHFVDETRVDITEHSRLLIDEFVYDPGNDRGSLSLKASLGTVRYASGQIAKKYKQNVKIRTPSATIGVRGTDFVLVVDEVGSTMVTLLPSCDEDGYCFTGEIEVQTDVGFVIMNQAFQATQVDVPENRPINPVIIELDESLITNLLIIRKPPKLKDKTTQIHKSTSKKNPKKLIVVEKDNILAKDLSTNFNDQLTVINKDILESSMSFTHEKGNRFLRINSSVYELSLIHI